MGENFLKTLRESKMISKTELARKAGISCMTLNSVEDGANCRLETKRKILLALSIELSDREKVFPNG